MRSAGRPGCSSHNDLGRPVCIPGHTVSIRNDSSSTTPFTSRVSQASSPNAPPPPTGPAAPERG
ncbi:hypothetical protein FNV68_02395 [Streptomyces sp. S1D4-23]|nr:hypothetical protein FNV61_00920 [Streptomyces sp. RLB3-6]QDO05360.1 hypothetical protein FNV68_02395 [Streptomyces sp. S1D4-23]